MIGFQPRRASTMRRGKGIKEDRMQRRRKLFTSATTVFVVLLVGLLATACGQSSSAESQATATSIAPTTAGSAGAATNDNSPASNSGTPGSMGAAAGSAVTGTEQTAITGTAGNLATGGNTTHGTTPSAAAGSAGGLTQAATPAAGSSGVTGTNAVTSTNAVTGTNAVTSTNAVTGTNPITSTNAVTGSNPITSTNAMTGTNQNSTTGGMAMGATGGADQSGSPTPRPPLPTPRPEFKPQAAQGPTATPPAAAEQLGAQQQPPPPTGEWTTFGYDLEQTRHTSLAQITKDNVRNLGRAWSVDFQDQDKTIPGGQEGYPLVISGTVYVSTSFDHAFALDATTGRVKWHFSPGEIGKFHNFGLNFNRGLAYCDNTLYMLTLDMRIMAIDAGSGTLVKSINIADTIPEARTEYGYYETAAPICYDGTLLIGSSGGDNGFRGFVMAYNAKDLTPAWPNPYWTVPPTNQDWRSQGVFHGGGAVWMPVSIDTTSGTAYFSVGNPSPDFYPELRPGNNPKTNSVIAVDVKTGQEKWWKQQQAGDQWDYDTSTPPMVFTGQVNGQPRRVVAVGNKAGHWFLYDAQTGDPIYESVKVLDTDNHQPLQPGKAVEAFPSSLGGFNYGPMSYDPGTNYAIITTVESKTILVQARSAEEVDKARARGDVDTGTLNGFGTTPLGWHDYGSISAIDINTGQIAWKFRTSEPERGGVTTTASGIAFVGGGDGYLRALDTSNGAVLWAYQTGAPIAAAPSVYEANGIEYVVVTVGGTSTSSQGGKISQIMAFAIGGDPMQFASAGNESTGTAPEEVVKQSLQGNSQAAEFISIDKDVPNQIDLTVIAALSPVNGGLNFNGYDKGGAAYHVPEGWTIKVLFRNLSTQSPHSAVVAPDGEQNQVRVTHTAFPDSAMPNYESGITSGSSAFTFKAEKQGKYVLICGLPGHGQAGQWLWFYIDAPDSQPSWQAGDQQPYVPPTPNGG